MAITSATGVRKTTRLRKTTLVAEPTMPDATLSPKILKPAEDVFTKLIVTITTAREEYEALQKQIAEIKEAWEKEQRIHATIIRERDQQEEVERRREKELYEYETTLKRRQVEDEFAEKKARWEKELAERKDEIAKEKEELEFLRKQVDGFEEEKEKAVKDASLRLQKELTERFATEKKLREQEVKSEQELLAFKITNLTSENERQGDEIAALKKSLEQATAQLKDVAVKVIESGSPAPKPPTVPE